METVNCSYALYVTKGETHPIGTVINRVLLADIADWQPPDGCRLIADPSGEYPIGSVYVDATS